MRRYLFLPVLIALGIAVGATVYVLNRQVPGPLTGESVSQDVANRRPVAVILDNFSPDARPQSGLAQASLVFETLAEGGITRFMAVYLERDAPMIGPVRSARLYFNSWAAGLGVIFGHDGGNVDALQELPTLSTVFNVDADRTPGPFWRIAARAAPHNEYTSTGRLRSYVQLHGGSVTGAPPALPHKDDAPLSQRPASFHLAIQFSYGDYDVSWTYDRASNSYARAMGGAPHVDAATGRQLTAKNVVVMVTDESPASDPFTPGAIHLRTEGTGAATVYEDGKAIAATWSKPSVGGTLQWLNASGAPIPLNRGTTWVEVVPGGTQVTAG
ncbi:MAG TPA: DUF3048 domain-containing protein [Chloroflexota bacterium]|nr:DUF3048 domain-containing protein [Chloroflexota bacterium]